MQLIERARKAYKESKAMPYLKLIIAIILGILGLQLVFTHLLPLINGTPFKMGNPLIFVSTFFFAGLLDIIAFLEIHPDESKKDVKYTIISMAVNFIMALFFILML